MHELMYLTPKRDVNSGEVIVRIQYWSLLNWQNVRLHCGCVAVSVNWFFTLFHHCSLHLRTLYIVWSLVRRRVTRRLTRLQTMCYSTGLIKLKKCAVALRLRCGFWKLIIDIISSFFAKFENVEHSLELGETPSYSASHQAPNYVLRF